MKITVPITNIFLLLFITVSAQSSQDRAANSDSSGMKPNKNKTVLLDGYFNHERKYDTISNDTVQFHYLWNEEDNNGYSLFGHAFNKYGVSTIFSAVKPAPAILKQANMYIIVDPDTPKENPNPNYIQPDDINVISNWVKEGGILLLLGNDSGNAEFDHFNNLAAVFGIHFNGDSYNKVPGSDFSMGSIYINEGNPVFKPGRKIFIKELSTLTIQPPAQKILTKENKIIMAVSKYGKGTVFALGDPWLYNEYTNGKKLPKDYENYNAAEDLVQWLIKQ